MFSHKPDLKIFNIQHHVIEQFYYLEKGATTETNFHFIFAFNKLALFPIQVSRSTFRILIVGTIITHLT